MPHKILIAEDERDIRELVKYNLTFAGFEVIEASNGVEAVDRTVAERPDLILMDVRMPKMTGYEACKRLKAIDEVKDIPVIFLSAKGQESEIQQGMDVGAVDYILKPFEQDYLTDKVNEVLRRGGEQQQ